MPPKFNLTQRKKLRHFDIKKPRKTQNIAELEYAKDKMAYYLERGLTLEESRSLSGVSKSVLGVLRSDPAFEEFVNVALTGYELEHLEEIQDASKSGQWRASTWILERLKPEKYGKKDTIRHEYDVKVSSLLNIIVSIINDADPRLKKKVLIGLRNAKLDMPNGDISILDVENTNEEIVDI